MGQKQTCPVFARMSACDAQRTLEVTAFLQVPEMTADNENVHYLFSIQSALIIEIDN